MLPWNGMNNDESQKKHTHTINTIENWALREQLQCVPNVGTSILCIMFFLHETYAIQHQNNDHVTGSMHWHKCQINEHKL